MGHRVILDLMKQLGAKAGHELKADPMRGYLANLDPDDYKKLFRPLLPEHMRGGEFLLKHGGTIDTATKVEPDISYHLRSATNHHVLESMRVKNFVRHVEDAAAEPANSGARKLSLDKAGHLMYASHISYTKDALLGADECDLLVRLVREREVEGLYGAKITGGGSGGTVAVLCDQGEQVDRAIRQIMEIYHKETGNQPEAFLGTSPGAWHVGTRELPGIG